MQNVFDKFDTFDPSVLTPPKIPTPTFTSDRHLTFPTMDPPVVSCERAWADSKDHSDRPKDRMQRCRADPLEGGAEGTNGM